MGVVHFIPPARLMDGVGWGFIIIIIIIIINCKCVYTGGFYPVVVCYKARQENTIEYNTEQYSTIQYNKTHHTKSQTTLKATFYILNYKKNQEHIYYTLLRPTNE